MTLLNERRVEFATRDDVQSLHRLRRDLEDWLADKGVQQWPRGEVGQQDIIRQVDSQEWRLVRHSEIGVAAAMRVLWSDPDVWGKDATPAIYIHGLMVDRAMAGLDMGTFMLHWAATLGRKHGVNVCRLDCVETNSALRSFYRQQGFQEVGRRDFRRIFSATLFEKKL